MRYVTMIVCLLGVLLHGGERELSLAGEWRFALDPTDAGQKERWQERPLADTIRLPGTTDEAGYGPATTGSDHGVLTRLHKYYGPSWYQRDIEIPEAWRGLQIELFLERVMWESRVWIGGASAGTQDSLATPHVHALGRLAPGKHRLTIRISNAPIHPLGNAGHCYTEQTQTIWNGAVGRIELRARPPVMLGLVRTFPRAKDRALDVEVGICNLTGAVAAGTVKLALKEADADTIVARAEAAFTAQGARETIRSTLRPAEAPRLWDEFTPHRYALEATLVSPAGEDARTIACGFRDVTRQGAHIAINGRPTFMRGNLDCVHFPLTGYPAVRIEDWKRIFRIYKEHGLNLVRFHSWTPPEAAFAAADALGIYIHTEVVWTQRPLGSDVPGPIENMSPEFPPALLTHPGTIDAFVRAEITRVVDTYGNHPSFVMFCIGNEMGSADMDVTGRWMAEEKARDGRRLYAVTTARKISPSCDYSVTHAIPSIGWCRDRVEPFNDWDYEDLYRKAPVPIIAHEVGQWPTYVDFAEIARYTGVLRARNLEGFKALAERNGVRAQAAEFRAASGALAIRLYKDEIESHLRTPSCAGFELLSMQDFSGQGEALVGWLDSFYATKGIVTPERVRRFCGPTVVLARLPKYVFTASETLQGRIEVANYAQAACANVRPVWRLRDAAGNVLAEGRLQPAASVATGTVTPLGELTVSLNVCSAPCRVRLEAALEDTSIANDWDLWVFPERVETATPPGIVECTRAADARAALARGANVLLCAHTLGDERNAHLAAFKPVYWSASFFPGSETLGALVAASHAALARFPTENHLDWQWQEVCRGARGFQLDGLPADYRPIVQPISDFHFNFKLGAVFELRVGTGALLVCGYDIVNDLAKRPAARQLRHSLLAYMASDRFTPTQTMTPENLEKLFPVFEPAPRADPPPADKALLFVLAGGKHPGSGNVPWSRDVDTIAAAAPGFDYTVACEAVWKDSVGTAWHGSPSLKVSVHVPRVAPYALYAHLHDWNENGRRGTLLVAGKKYGLGAHTGAGVWVKFDVAPEDVVENTLTLEARVGSGPNLQITAIALVPAQ